MFSLFMPKDLHQIADYRRFWLSQFLAFMANQILMMAFGWHVYSMTNSALSLGYIGLALFLPQFLLVLVVGQVADRFNRRHIVMLTQGLEALIAALLMIATYWQWQSSTLIYVAAFSIGAVRAFQAPAMQAMIPGLIPLDILPKAIAVSSASRQFATIAGPALGGFLFVVGNSFVYGVAALLFTLALFSMWRIERRQIAAPKQPVTLDTVFAGVRYIWQKPVILGAISLDLFSVFIGSATALFPIFAEQILHTGSWGLGMLRAAPALGALVVAIYIARFPLREKVGRTMFIGVAIFGLTTIVFGLSQWFLLSLAMLAVMGGADMLSVVVRSSLIQLQTPHDMRGRVGAVNSIFIGASNQLGDFESGVVAEVVGAAPAVVIGGIGTLLVAALWIRWFPSLYRWDTFTIDPAAVPKDMTDAAGDKKISN